MTYEETLAHFGVRGMRWGVRKQTEDSLPTAAPAIKEFVPGRPSAPLSVIDKSDSRPKPDPRPIAGKIAVGVGVGIAATAAVALGSVFVANQMKTNPAFAFKVSGFGKKATQLADAPDLIRRASTRVYDQPVRRAIEGGTKAIGDGVRVAKSNGSVYNIVSDKKWQKSAKVGKTFTEKVLIGNIGGISIADLKK